MNHNSNSESRRPKIFTFAGCDTGQTRSKELKVKVPVGWIPRMNVLLDEVPEFEHCLGNLLRSAIYSGMVDLDRRIGEQGRKDAVWELRKLGEEIIEKQRLRQAMLDEVHEALAALPDLGAAQAKEALERYEKLCKGLAAEDKEQVGEALQAARNAMGL